ncbi:MAG: hypothetical protein NDJ24_05270 [Alphaproteobacteria bacterium]|nr:hypothetical protein [Alphaproteobacteria bacterium]
MKISYRIICGFLGLVIGGLCFPFADILFVEDQISHDPSKKLLFSIVVMAATSIYVSCKYDFKMLLVLTAGFYIGINTLPYLFDQTETWGWYVPAMIFNFAFVAIPFLLGAGAVLTNISIRKGE